MTSSRPRSTDTTPPEVVDGLGRPLRLAAPLRSIVSLVPSLTEALFAIGLSEQVTGRTAYCVEPAGRVERVPALGGTKNPDLDRIMAIRPDLVIASAEENVREHVETLIDTGLPVYVSLCATVRRAIEEIEDLARLTGRPDAAASWIADARAAVDDVEQRAARRPPTRYFCPIWRRPYMVAGPQTYMSDLLRLCGGESIFGPGPARYYPVDLADVAARSPDLILLPSEPYPFAEKHRAEILALPGVPAVEHRRVHLINGQLITWYGPRIAASVRSVAALFEDA